MEWKVLVHIHILGSFGLFFGHWVYFKPFGIGVVCSFDILFLFWYIVSKVAGNRVQEISGACDSSERCWCRRHDFKKYYRRIFLIKMTLFRQTK
jgi:hypothetical protein